MLQPISPLNKIKQALTCFEAVTGADMGCLLQGPWVMHMSNGHLVIDVSKQKNLTFYCQYLLIFVKFS